MHWIAGCHNAFIATAMRNVLDCGPRLRSGCRQRNGGCQKCDDHHGTHIHFLSLTLELSGGIAVRLNEMLELNDVYIAGELT